jgi:protein-S-isoprenylcysteine O-methyltransferase Ste14
VPKGFPDLPPVWALGSAIAAWALARWAPFAVLPGEMGWVMMGAGIGLVVWAAVWFLRKRTPIEPHRAPRALIVEGPYRINRNPIYSGFVLILLGWGLWLGALSALMPAVVFALVVDRRFVRAEEAALRAAFGTDAERFFAATRRW